VPGRAATRAPRAGEPKPFSSEWLAADTPIEPAPTRFRLPAWIPDGRGLSAGMVVVVSLVTAVIAFRGEPSRSVSPGVVAPTVVATVAASLATESEPVPAPTAAVQAALEAVPEALEPESADPVMAAPASAVPNLMAGADAQLASAPAEGFLLPEYRIVTYYGHPHDPNMGIVGEYQLEALTSMLLNEAAAYAEADPSRPVIPAFELIATVAQPVPGSDGTYILDTDHETLRTYIDYAEANGLLVVLDLQVGRGTVTNEIEKVRDLLARPNVHLALDPEFAVAEGQIPGEYIGSLPAESITYAQQVLAEIAAEHGIPPKLLIVHQFREDMITGKGQLAPYPGVQLVIDADGYGAPELKTAVYNFLVRDEPVEFAGVKLFYKQDVPLMSPQEILALVPAPDVIIYQ
jgi:hypothetical protein